MLIVFEEDKREYPIFSKRMMILDRKVSVEASVKRATLLDQRDYKHEVDFKVLHPAYEIDNPFGNVYTVITQNNRWDNAIKNLSPIFVKNNELIYNYEEENLFDGGNEYRFFDSKVYGIFLNELKTLFLKMTLTKLLFIQIKNALFNVTLTYGKTSTGSA